MKHVLAFILLAFQLQAADFKLGWKPDKAGVRDAQFKSLRTYRATAILPKTDQRARHPKVYDQGALGSCVGNGVADALDYAHAFGPKRFVYPSRLFVYYNGRMIEGTVDEDSGLQIRSGIDAAFRFGACGENTRDGWAYDIARFTEQPPAKCYRAAMKRQAIKGYKVDNTDGRSIRVALSADFPVVFGAYVYRDIETVTAANPILPMPRGAPIGGHCMVIVGHDDARQLYLVRNSWGVEWGDRGHCWMPYAYVHNGRICEDFWVIESAE